MKKDKQPVVEKKGESDEQTRTVWYNIEDKKVEDETSEQHKNDEVIVIDDDETTEIEDIDETPQRINIQHELCTKSQDFPHERYLPFFNSNSCKEKDKW